jgi:CRISPR system Cascade subunit CasB
MTQATIAGHFVAHLERLAAKRDRAALAALRRGLTGEPAAMAAVYPYVVPWLPPDVPPWREDAFYTVASLFALHPQGWPNERTGPRDFGASFAWLKSRASSDQAIDRRFQALLACHPDELREHLRHAISLFAANDVPVDWARLIGDIVNWRAEDRFVQRRWARSFWGQAADAAAVTAGVADDANADAQDDSEE